MKILLISSNTLDTPYAVYPLGMSMIASALRNAGHSTLQFDILQAGKTVFSAAEAVEKFSPDLVGISIRNIDNANMINEQKYIDFVKGIVDAVKLKTNSPIVAGGPGFSIMPELILEKIGADYGIAGEGEELIVKLAEDIESGNYPKQKLFRAPSKLTENLIPSADYDSKLTDFYFNSGGIGAVQTKRGCPHKCIYCSYPIIEGVRVRYREPKFVVTDMEILKDKHHAKEIFFTDSVFNDDKGYYLEVIKEMKRRRFFCPWTAYFKPKGLTDDIVELMRETGLESAEIGTDASTDKTLRILGKSFLFNDIIESNRIFTQHGIAAANFYMFGCPGETKDTVLQGIENIKKTADQAVSLMFMGIRILPNTGLERIAIQDKIITQDCYLLEPVYYISPQVDKEWMEETLTNAFRGLRHCVFPPDSLDNNLKMLHQMGYSGSLWNMLLKRRKRK